MRLLTLSSDTETSTIAAISSYTFYAYSIAYLIAMAVVADYMHKQEESCLNSLKAVLFNLEGLSSISCQQLTVFATVVKDLSDTSLTVASMIPLNTIFLFSFFAAVIPFSVMLKSLLA